MLEPQGGTGELAHPQTSKRLVLPVLAPQSNLPPHFLLRAKWPQPFLEWLWQLGLKVPMKVLTGFRVRGGEGGGETLYGALTINEALTSACLP